MKRRASAKALLVISATAQVLGALVALAGQLTDVYPLLSTPAALTTVAVATALRAVIYTAGDLMDDGKANNSL